jgi:hypothetical protein
MVLFAGQSAQVSLALREQTVLVRTAVKDRFGYMYESEGSELHLLKCSVEVSA